MRNGTSACGRSKPTNGFTMLEVMLASGLMTLLVVLIGQVWSGLGGPSAAMVARCRVAQEARLALTSLCADLGGFLANSEGRLGTQAAYPFVGRLQPGQAELWLCFDGGINPNGVADWGPPDTVIQYSVKAGQLIRWDQTAGTHFTVARNVDRLHVQDLGGGQVQLQLTFTYRQVTQSFTLIARNP
jgi:type II secretory pathway component PulJ